MSVAEFIAAIAWPLTVLAIALLFRRPLTEALGSSQGKLSAGPFGLEWNKWVGDVESDLGLPPSISKGRIGGAAGKLDEIAMGNPTAAIVESFGAVERTLRSVLQDAGVGNLDDQWSVRRLAELASEQGLITRETYKAIEGLSVLRNLAAHGGEREVSEQRAHEFVALTQGVLYAISAGA